MIPLDRNESYWMLDEELLKAATSTEAGTLSKYPEYGELKKEIARYAGVSPEQVLVSPGSDAAIEHIARVFAGKGAEVILPVPTFYGYETILDRMGVSLITPVYTEEQGQFVFPLAETVMAMERSHAQILFLCHPNNPLGCALSSVEIDALLSAAQKNDTIIVSDEAYFEFSDKNSFLPSLSTTPHLMVLRTFSKSFALAGARVGYAIAAPSIIQTLEQTMLPWPIAHASVYAARALLAQEEKVRTRRELLIRERAHFHTALTSIPGVTSYPSQTNFILIRLPHAEKVQEALLSAGIRVALAERMSRFAEAKQLLHETLRMAVPSPEDQSVVLSVLKQFHS